MAYKVGYTNNNYQHLNTLNIIYLLWVHIIYQPILYFIGGLRKNDSISFNSHLYLTNKIIHLIGNFVFSIKDHDCLLIFKHSITKAVQRSIAYPTMKKTHLVL